MYPEEIVIPMKEEVTQVGFVELLTPEDVDNHLKKAGTTFVFINSICGCSAGAARPALIDIVKSSNKKPNQLVTSFAGFDKEAVNKIREYLLPYPPSSPCMALLKDGKLVHMVERHHIEGATAEELSNHLKAVFEKHC